MKQKLFSLIIALLIGAGVTWAQEVWDGTANTTWYSPSSTTFTISTAEELAGLAQLVNSGTTFEGKTVKLGADIRLNDTIGWNSRVTPAMWTHKEASAEDVQDSLVLAKIDGIGLQQWTPVSNKAQFAGTFDGGGHTVSGLYIESEILTYAGLFGCTGNGSALKNIHIANAFVKTTRSLGSASAGGLAGISLSAIDSCSSAAVASASSSTIAYSGGLVGQASTDASIGNSYATGAVSASAFAVSYSGGLVGYASTNASISNSYATGAVSASASSYAYSGGLMGYASDVIRNSYATGAVSAASSAASSAAAYSGGLVGQAGDAISNSYATGAVSASASAAAYVGGLAGSVYSGVTLTNAYYNSADNDVKGIGDGTPASGSATGKTTAQMQAPAFVDALNSGVADNTGYSRWTADYDNTNKGYPVFSDLSWYDADADRYIIYTARQLAAFGDLVNSGITFAGKTVKLGNDIRLNDTTNWDSRVTPASWTHKEASATDAKDSLLLAQIDGTSLRPWTPISNSQQFAGTFDGGGYTVSGLYIESETLQYAGLFGYTGSGSALKNIHIANAFVKTTPSSGGAYAGGLAGRSQSAIDSCSSAAVVSASAVSSAYSGGLVGYAASGSIRNSYATGNISASASSAAYSGGLVGVAASGSIRNSYATGNVSASASSAAAYSGGLVGYASTGTSISNSYATGNVSASAALSSSAYSGGLVGRATGAISNSYATGAVSASSAASSSSFSAYSGGLVGYATASISNSYATGNVSASASYAYSGGLAGYVSSAATLTNAYYNSADNVKGIGEGTPKSGSATGMTTAEMQAPAFVDVLNTWVNSNTGYSRWTADYDNTNKGYPVFADFSWYDADADRYIIYTVRQLEDFRDLVNSGTTFAGKTVKLGDDIRLNDTTGWDSRVTPASWTHKVASATDAKDSLLLAQIDNTNLKQWTPISTDNTRFAGTFDGDGHTVSGLYIESKTLLYAGLFGYIGRGSALKNIHIANAFVKTTLSSDDAYAGGLAGYSLSAIDSCSSAAVVSASSSSSYIAYSGGLVGYAFTGASISNSYATGNVSAFSAAFSAYSGGLVGLTYDAIRNSYATGDVSASASAIYAAYSGGLVGDTYGNISNSYAAGDVSSSSTHAYSGGLAGYASDAISNSYAMGAVSASASSAAYSGGLAGYADESISNSYATGNVSASASVTAYSGGLMGYASAGASISNSYAKGNVSASVASSSYAYSGGLVGYADESIRNSYAAGKATATGFFVRVGGLAGSVTSAATLTNAYYNSADNTNGIGYGTPADGSTITGKTTAEMQAPAFVKILNGWVDSNTGYSRWTADQENINKGYPVFGDFSWYDENADFYIIYTARQLEDFRDLVNSGITFEGKTVTLGNDIRLNDTTNWDSRVTPASWEDGNLVPASFDAPDGIRPWTPISNNRQFSGTFDGDGHTIAGLYIDGDMTYAGLFGFTNSGSELKNVHIANAFIKTTGSDINACAGGLVGLSLSVIDSCTSAAVVFAAANDDEEVGILAVGSLAGVAVYSISNSHASGDVSAFSIDGDFTVCGGLVGISVTSATFSSFAVLLNLEDIPSLDASISNSYATGNVYAYAETETNAVSGGLAGASELPVSDSYATGNVFASAPSSGGAASCGGLIGVSGAISNSYAFGNVSAYAGADATSGGLVGSLTSSIVSNSYASGYVSAYSVDGTAINGGLVGAAVISTISNSYALGNVSSDAGLAYSGGLMGMSYTSIISNSYAAGKVENLVEDAGAGGLIGSILFGGSITNAYYNSTLNGDENNGIAYIDDDDVEIDNVIGMETAGMQTTAFADLLNSGRGDSTDWYYWKSAADRQNGYPYHCLYAVSITGSITASDKVYDGTDAAELDLNNAILEGVQAGHDVSLDASGVTAVFADKNVGTNIAVTVSGSFSLSGANADNYTILQPDLSGLKADITAKELTVEWDTDTTFTYNGAEQAPTASATTGITGEAVTLNVTGGKDAGEHKAIATISPVNTNYTLTNDTLEFTIAAKALDVTWKDTTLTYNGASQKPTASIAGVGEDGVITLSVTGEGTDAGNYTATASTSNANYTLTNATQDFTIAAKSVNVDWSNTALTYNGTSQKPTASITGEGEDSVITLSVTGEQTDAGNYTATASTSNANYTLTNATQDFTIAAKSVDVDWSNTSLTYNGASQKPIASIAGVGEDGVITLSVTGEQTDAGNYTATASTSNANYTLMKATKEFTIAAKSVDVDWSNTALTYNGTSQKPTASIIGVGEDGVITLSVTGEQTDAGNYTATATTSNANYTLTNATQDFTIAAKSVDVDWSNTSLTYNGTSQKPTASIAGVGEDGVITLSVTGEGTDAGNYTATASTSNANYTLVKATQDFTIAAKSVDVDWSNTALTYNGASQKPTASITGEGEDGVITLSVTGEQTDAGNYTATASTSNANYTLVKATKEFTIDAKSANVDWSNTSLTYNGKTQAPTASITGEGEDGVITLSVTGGETNAGTYTATASLEDANYTLKDDTQEFTIDQAPLTITANDCQRIEGEDEPVFTVSYDGFVGGEDETVLGGTLSFDLSEDVSGKYKITPSGLTSDNYVITYIDGILTIQQTTVITNVSAEPATVVAYYNIVGQRLSGAPEHGIYIILWSDGKTEKVMRK